MGRKRYKPEEIVRLLRQAEVLHGQGMTMAEAMVPSSGRPARVVPSPVSVRTMVQPAA